LASKVKFIVRLVSHVKNDINKIKEKGEIKMNTITKIYILNKAKELILKGIYKTEITEKTKKGIEKLDAVADGFWDKLREYVKKEKEIDRKFIPNFAEEIGEEILEQGIEILSKEFDIKTLIQKAFDVEKKENPKIF
jgi:universal stress protein